MRLRLHTALLLATAAAPVMAAAEITPALIRDRLHAADGVEANVASGCHAIEFLLWGQDLNGTGLSAGDRPWTDSAQDEGCTGGNCDRRADYLIAATDLLVADLQQTEANRADDGAARTHVTEDPGRGLNAILTGIGRLSCGEQAGERMKLGLMLNDLEEEHDRFSDQTHMSHCYGRLGIRNVYPGSYARPDDSTVGGPSLPELVAGKVSAVDVALRTSPDASVAALTELRGKAEGEATITRASHALVAQTRDIERAVAALGLSQIAFEESEGFDNPTAVFQ